MIFLILEKFSDIYRNLYGARVRFIFHTYSLALFSNDQFCYLLLHLLNNKCFEDKAQLHY